MVTIDLEMWVVRQLSFLKQAVNTLISIATVNIMFEESSHLWITISI